MPSAPAVLKGLGLGNSVEKQLWLPESTNDFIFSVVCEELGFIGAVLIIVLFVLFLVQGLLDRLSRPRTGTARWWASASWHRSRGRCSATSPWSPTPCPTPASACPSSPPAAPA
ncbi:MAG: FtsW/RodA/SpoVE family cell cycle protein [Faecalibacterium prausnitzii]